MVKEACPRKWRKIQERSHVLWLGVWTFILKNWNRKLSRLILHVWALIVADLKSRCAFAFSFLWTWGLTALCFLLSSYICSFCLESYEHRYSHTIFPNTIFTFTMNFFKNRKEITFEKEINFAPLLLSHQKLHKCTKEGGGGFQKWLHCDICPWCITESVSLRWGTIGRRIEWKECTASNILWCCPENFHSWGVYLFFQGAVETSCVMYVSVCVLWFFW